MQTARTYIAIDLKSFYASVECVERGLDPLSTHLVVADASRTEKTICLAVSPSLKAYGIGGRARLFEVVERVKQVNSQRRDALPNRRFTGKSVFADELASHPDWEVDYLTAPPRMAHYIDFSTRIYDIYLRYIAPEDIHVYSIDEVFIDATPYLATYRMTGHELAKKMIKDVLTETGITATAGIGTNLYLCKVAMDIVAKHTAPDADGVRIAELDEQSYRHELWDHHPLTDFWRVGRGIVQRLAPYGIDTMGKLARLSLTHEELLYRLFGVNAELLIDHAWGWEPCTIEAIKAYKPETHSLSNGQVLSSPYEPAKARVVAQEMAENMALQLVRKKLVTDQLVLSVGYDPASLTDASLRAVYKGKVTTDRYGRQVPVHAHGTLRLGTATSSSHILIRATTALFDRIVSSNLLVHFLGITAAHVTPAETTPEQLDLFDQSNEDLPDSQLQTAEKEQRMQEAMLSIKQKFGKNAILRGLNFEEGATARERNQQIGGHKA
ncbi:MAG: DNA methylase [Bacteroidaceae bacterium]|nr:DNA methylase [Bacteroidaceae bacterium]